MENVIKPKTVVAGKRFGEERALYLLRDAAVNNCRFEGAEDGESALKECARIGVKDCFFDLRYPLWHGKDVAIEACEFSKNCRTALWYARGVSIKRSKLCGIKALRECRRVSLEDVEADSPEFGWRCRGLSLKNCTIDSEYAFFESRNLTFDHLELEGKYSFQYTKDLAMKHSSLKTKDAFWHAKNATVSDSVLAGEYLGWYSEGLTLIRCEISGTQPLCYCKNLKLIDCTMKGCDLAFEYSDVEADLRGSILSVKNPKSGRITADAFGQIILSDSKYPTKAKIEVRS